MVNIPENLRRLPFDLRRDALVTRNPKQVAAAMEAYREHLQGGRPLAKLLPQRMAFQQWKTSPNQERRDWSSSAESFMAVQSRYRAGVPRRLTERIPPAEHVYPVRTAAQARGGRWLPQQPAPVARPAPLSRTLPEQAPRAAPPSVIAEAYPALVQRAIRRRAGQRLRAVQEANRAIARGAAIVRR